jgi:hypothetical protein
MKRIALIVLFVALGSLSVFAQDATDITPDYNFPYQYDIKADKYNTKAAAEFFDYPSRFTGKTIRIIARLTAGGKLQATVGYNVRFIAYTEAPMEYFFVTIPKDLEVPNVSEWTDTIIITFRCEQGLLDKGNIALSITRANR